MTVGRVASNEGTEEFFAGTAAGQFLIKRCTPHGHASRPQAKVCDVCASDELTSEAASGRALLVSWVVVQPRVPDGTEPPPPTIPAIGALEEGPWWWAAVVGADPETLYGGQPLRIAFEQPEESEAVPVFVVDGEAPG
jgi:uncharacterized OB-fold protein